MERIFNNFTNQTGIELPKNILKSYSNGRNSKSEFVRLFKSNFETNKNISKPELSILISEKFAFEILKVIHDIPKEDRYNSLFQELVLLDKNFYKGKKMIPSLNSEKLIIEEVFYHVNSYNYGENKFDFQLIQKAYENFGANFNEMKVILILWAHCGGEGGIIIKGKNVGFDSGYTHGETMEIEFNGEKYDYYGYVFENDERLHKPIIESSNL